MLQRKKCHLAVQEESGVLVDDVLDVAVEDRGADALDGFESALCQRKCRLSNSATRHFVKNAPNFVK
jgi:hypothetical protein